MDRIRGRFSRNPDQPTAAPPFETPIATVWPVASTIPPSEWTSRPSTPRLTKAASFQRLPSNPDRYRPPVPVRSLPSPPEEDELALKTPTTPLSTLGPYCPPLPPPEPWRPAEQSQPGPFRTAVTRHIGTIRASVNASATAIRYRAMTCGMGLPPSERGEPNDDHDDDEYDYRGHSVATPLASTCNPSGCGDCSYLRRTDTDDYGHPEDSWYPNTSWHAEEPFQPPAPNNRHPPSPYQLLTPLIILQPPTPQPSLAANTAPAPVAPKRSFPRAPARAYHTPIQMDDDDDDDEDTQPLALLKRRLVVSHHRSRSDEPTISGPPHLTHQRSVSAQTTTGGISGEPRVPLTRPPVPRRALPSPPTDAEDEAEDGALTLLSAVPHQAVSHRRSRSEEPTISQLQHLTHQRSVSAQTATGGISGEPRVPRTRPTVPQRPLPPPPSEEKNEDRDMRPGSSLGRHHTVPHHRSLSEEPTTARSPHLEHLGGMSGQPELGAKYRGLARAMTYANQHSRDSQQRQGAEDSNYSAAYSTPTTPPLTREASSSSEASLATEKTLNIGTDTKHKSLPSPPGSPLPSTADFDASNRSPHRLVAYIVPFPEPPLSTDPFAIQSPRRFMLYTPPPAPLQRPTDGSKERPVHAVHRMLQKEVRSAYEHDHQQRRLSNMRAKATRGVDKAFDKVTSNDIDFWTRVRNSRSVHRQQVAKDDVDDAWPCGAPDEDIKDAGDDDLSKVTELVLIYPPNIGVSVVDLKNELLDSLHRAKSKSTRDIIIASGMIPLATGLDAALTCFGFSLVSAVSALYFAHTISSAMTVKSIIKLLTGASPDFKLTFKASHRADNLADFLRDRCAELDPVRFQPSAKQILTFDVLKSIGWEAANSDNWGDERWERRKAQEDLDRVMDKAAGQWHKWCIDYDRNPKRAVKR